MNKKKNINNNGDLIKNQGEIIEILIILEFPFAKTEKNISVRPAFVITLHNYSI